ncbi:hypothetical protein AV530_008793 [Patagioenas fasciata monilis]|uniref:Uncharacterized protein n=1 Tax=Patagioenas fasciata monilis TaxID=372326 RepID=A0A1V4JI97_PATFA|nr:hypothetical protein AV530_008793 [Patagioenas fasciata monilis]
MVTGPAPKAARSMRAVWLSAGRKFDTAGFISISQHGRSLGGDLGTSWPMGPHHGPVHQPWTQVLSPRNNRSPLLRITESQNFLRL